jgi:phage terminase large subunit-like protein
MNKIKLLQQELYARSYYEFFIASLHVLEPTLKFENNWHIKYLCDELQIACERVGKGNDKLYDIVINVPPRSMKSTIVTISLNAWLWIKYPELRLISTSYSSSLATEHCQKSRGLIESQWYQELFNETFSLLKDNNQKTNFENNKKGHRQISSVGTGTTGKGGDIIIFDDLLTPSLAASENGRITMDNYFFNTMYNRLNNPKTGLRIIVEQRLHENDLTGLILEKGMKVKQICLPVIDGGNVLPVELKYNYIDGMLFTNRFDKETLEDFKLRLGPSEFATQYLQMPSPDTGLIIQEEWLKQRFNATDIPEAIVRHFVSDTAYGRDNNSDYNATLCYSELNGHYYIWDYFNEIMPFNEYISAHKSFLSANSYTNESKDEFEPKATGVSVVQVLQSEGINAIFGPNPTDSKLIRTKAKTPMMMANKLHFLKGKSWDILIHQAKTFPNGKNDDLVDCLVNMLDLSIDPPTLNYIHEIYF